MAYKISPPKELEGCIDLPSSKSISNRALLIQALGGFTKEAKNLSSCDDTFVMRRALKTEAEVIDVMAAGTSMRFLTAYFSLKEGERTITGSKRMKERPIGVLVDALRELGASITYEEKEGYPPLRIRGKELIGGELTMPGHVSSQFISALLMIGPRLKKGLLLNLEGTIISRPYIDLTLQMISFYGAKAYWLSNRSIRVESGNYNYKPLVVESDWSAASYWYALVALSRKSAIKLLGVTAVSWQGDAMGAELFEQLGVETEYVDGGVRLVRKRPKVALLDTNFIKIPDLAQTFVVACALLSIPFHFTGLQSLKVKETDRLVALQNEMRKLGFLLESDGESTLTWRGGTIDSESTFSIDTYEDHRMAMAFAVASMKIDDFVINNPEVVTKSYPTFWEDLKKVGFLISEVKN